jgi:hypothetical protein
MHTPINKQLQHAAIQNTLNIPVRSIINVRDAELVRPEHIVGHAVRARAIKPEGVVGRELESCADKLARDGRGESC